MHIWYIHPYGGGPGLGLYDRPYQLARAWGAQGHSATVFIARFHHLLEKDVSPEPDFEIGGVRYVSVPTRPYAQNGLSRLANMWDFSRNLYGVGQEAGRRIPEPDAIVVSSPHPFVIFPAHRLARRHKAKLVFEIRDIWPLSITEILGTSRLHPFVQMCAAAERFALGRSDLIASVLPRAGRYLADRGYGEKPFVWVPNGIGAQEESRQVLLGDDARKIADTLSEWERDGYTTIVHAGRLGKPNAVDVLLEALSVGVSRGQADKCRVLLLGVGEQMSHLRAFAESRGLKDVHFAGRVSKAEVAPLLDFSHIGYAGIKPFDRLYRYGVSLNKFSDYFNASLPVFMPIAACGDPVSESGGGIARKAETPEAAWEALRELLHLSPEERRAMGEKGRAYMAREYDYGRIAGRYADAILAA